MPDMTIKEMFQLQKDLHAVYAKVWDPLIPQTAISSLLWALGEAGEVIDILKKQGWREVAKNQATKEEFIEETCDVLMYLIDTLLCFDINPEDLDRIYRAKHQNNLGRWRPE